jgi:hypothetical protein
MFRIFQNPNQNQSFHLYFCLISLRFVDFLFKPLSIELLLLSSLFALKVQELSSILHPNHLQLEDAVSVLLFYLWPFYQVLGGNIRPLYRQITHLV